MKRKEISQSRSVANITKLDVAKIKAETAINKDRLFVTQWQSLVAAIDAAARNGYSMCDYDVVDNATAVRIVDELRKTPGITVEEGGTSGRVLVIRW